MKILIKQKIKEINTKVAELEKDQNPQVQLIVIKLKERKFTLEAILCVMMSKDFSLLKLL